MAEDMILLPKAEILTLEELDRHAAPSSGWGAQAPLTGGEPLVRKNMMSLSAPSRAIWAAAPWTS
jgi:cyclic pyranopterin phosphate synthase